MHAEDPGYATFARELADIAVTGEGERLAFGPVTLGLVPVTVTHQVVGYLRRRLDGDVIDFIELDMPEHTLPTTAAMYTIDLDALLDNAIDAPRIPGSLHAAEHAAIGLRLVASCDRSDIGGMSTAIGPDGLPSVFVTTAIRAGQDSPNGASSGEHLVGATAAPSRRAECPSGCPSCVQSPKCATKRPAG